MREGTYFGLIVNGVLVGGEKGLVCTICGDMHKSCYRKPYHGSWLYYIMPCHRCCPAEFQAHPQRRYVDMSSRWIDIPEADQIRRIDRDRIPPPIPDTLLSLAEQALNPASEDVDNEVRNE